jgi:TonB family protein
VLAAVVCSVLPVFTQTGLPPPEQALVLAVRSSRQATPQGPYELTLASTKRITVTPLDVHDPATLYVRGALEKQASPPVSAELLFVLQVQRVTPQAKSQVDVTLKSGAVVRVAASDITDPRLTFLRTALAEAFAFERADQHRANLALQREYVESMFQRIRQNWKANQGAAGRVTLKFVVQRDGRITDIEVKESGGEVLDLASMSALMVTGRLAPLPREYPDKTLTLEMVFEYQR